MLWGLSRPAAQQHRGTSRTQQLPQLVLNSRCSPRVGSILTDNDKSVADTVNQRFLSPTGNIQQLFWRLKHVSTSHWLLSICLINRTLVRFHLKLKWRPDRGRSASPPPVSLPCNSTLSKPLHHVQAGSLKLWWAVLNEIEPSNFQISWPVWGSKD